MPPEQTPEPNVPQAVTESLTPPSETPAPVTEPAIETATPPQEASSATATPEVSPAPAEAQPAETAPDSAEATTGTQPASPTDQMGRNEPLAPESDPIPPPSAEAPQAQLPATPPSPEVIAPVIVQPTRNLVRDILAKASVALQDRKRKKRDKIMQALTTKTPTTLKLRRAGEITNDEVEKLLHVSDATATRYLSVLVKEGKIQRVGKTGQGVVYSKI